MAMDARRCSTLHKTNSNHDLAHREFPIHPSVSATIHAPEQTSDFALVRAGFCRKLHKHLPPGSTVRVCPAHVRQHQDHRFGPHSSYGTGVLSSSHTGFWVPVLVHSCNVVITLPTDQQINIIVRCTLLVPQISQVYCLPYQNRWDHPQLCDSKWYVCGKKNICLTLILSTVNVIEESQGNWICEQRLTVELDFLVIVAMSFCFIIL